MDKRTNKKIVTKRTTSTTDNAPQNLSYTFEESLIYVVKVKRANNLKERTIAGYVQNMNYFFGWIVERYGHIAIHEVTASMVRDYILWCAQEKTYNEGHPYKSEFQKDRRGIEPSSVNVRIRVLKTFFNILVS